MRFAAATSFRLLVLGSLWQLCFLTLSPEDLVPTLRAWGVRRGALIVALGSLAVLPDVVTRSQQVLIARYARGFLGSASWWSRVRQLPFLLPPLVAWVLRASIQRGENWQHRGLIQNLENIHQGPTVPWSASSLSLLAIAFLWLAFGIFLRMN